MARHDMSLNVYATREWWSKKYYGIQTQVVPWYNEFRYSITIDVTEKISRSPPTPIMKYIFGCLSHNTRYSKHISQVPESMVVISRNDLYQLCRSVMRYSIMSLQVLYFYTKLESKCHQHSTHVLHTTRVSPKSTNEQRKKREENIALYIKSV